MGMAVLLPPFEDSTAANNSLRSKLKSVIPIVCSGCTAPDFLDTELSLFMQRLLAQGAAAELAAA
jgi:hypothetical protein